MNRFRKLAIFLLVLYTAVVFAAGLHVHAGSDQSALHCQLCQITNVSLIQTFVPHCTPGTIQLGLITSSQTFEHIADAGEESSGRSPPLS
jgi:hypothetical protein